MWLFENTGRFCDILYFGQERAADSLAFHEKAMQLHRAALTYFCDKLVTLSEIAEKVSEMEDRQMIPAAAVKIFLNAG